LIEDSAKEFRKTFNHQPLPWKDFFACFGFAAPVVREHFSVWAGR
jgi:hypothetical protein